MLFGSPASLKPFTEEFSLSFLGNTLFRVFSAKDVGVTLDAYMKFDEHISLLLLNAWLIKLCQIRRIRHLLDQGTLCSVVQSLVFTRLFYCPFFIKS
jgi:hypothetical protein